MAKVELKDKLTMTFEQINPCERKYSFVIDQEAVTAETSKVLRMFANSVVIPGFRKGKAPASIIQTKYTEDVKEELKKHIVSTAVQKAIGDDKDKVIGVTEKNGVSKVELGAEYKFDLTVYYNPSITLPQYKGLTVELAPVQASDEEVNQRLDYMRQAGYRYVTVEGAAQAEDMLKVSYTSDFALPDNASASLKRQVCSDSNWLWLKTPPVVIPGAIEALTGAEKDKEYDVVAVFPADWKDKELAGATINYKIKVLDIQRQSQTSDEELCGHFKVANMDELRGTIKDMVLKEKESRRGDEVFDVVYKQLSEAIGIFHLPEVLLESATNKFIRQIVSEKVKSEEDAKNIKDEIEAIRQQAAKTAAEFVRHNLIIGEIARSEKISVTGKEMEDQLKMMAKMYGKNYKDLAKNMSEDDLVDMEKYVIADKVKKMLAQNTTINVKAGA